MFKGKLFLKYFVSRTRGPCAECIGCRSLGPSEGRLAGSGLSRGRSGNLSGKGCEKLRGQTYVGNDHAFGTDRGPLFPSSHLTSTANI